MNWSSTSDFKVQLQRLWERGELFAELFDGEQIFPLRLKLKGPSSAEMAHRFDEIRAWISEMRSMPNCRVVMREINHRLIGKNFIPAEVWLDSTDDALTWIGKRKDFARLANIVEVTRLQQPLLLPWLKRNPFIALDNADKWEQLLQVVDWMQAHPRPGIYTREVVIPGLHSKFIEEHASLLSQLFDEVLPGEAIDRTAAGARKFAARYGFSEERPLIRFRILDERLALLPGAGDQDIALDWETFARLNPNVRRVFITENKTNFLAFPSLPESMVVFGAGYGFEHLGAASWLFHCDIHYWGDIDTHGFAALHGARKYFPHIRSLMMDAQTISQFQHLSGNELKAHEAQYLDNLSESEQSIFSALKAGKWGKGFRLEQEHVDWDYANAAIRAACAGDTREEQRASSRPLRLHYNDISTYLRPSKCDLRVYLAEQGAPTDGISPHDEAIRHLALRHLHSQRDALGDCLDLSLLEDDARISATLEAIRSRVPIIHKPLLAVQCPLAGAKVEIVGEADFLILEGDDYVIRNVSLLRRIEANGLASHQAPVSGGQLFSWLMQRSVQEHPSRIEILNGQNEIISVPDTDAALLRLICAILAAKFASAEPYSPVGWSKCMGCRFNTRCWNAANEASDVALLPGVDQELARILHRQGVANITALISAYDEKGLANVSRVHGDRSIRVGKRAGTILAMARAFSTGSPVWLQPPELPQALNWVVIDFEGMPPHLDGPELVFLYGMQVFGSQPGPYMSSLADCDAESDAQAWRLFLQNANSIFAEYGEIPFVHWHHYEPTMLRKYTERFGDPDGIASRIADNLIDLLPVLQASVALPLSSYSLKVVEKYIGFSRSQSEYGGEWAMSQFLKSLAAGDEGARSQILQSIQLYNQEDLEATYAVLSWLLTHVTLRNDALPAP
ncbi:MAG TPA: TM0106 family RecB-like putative nuclease [Candidatus Obscuribacterales bacterium]